MTCADLGAMYKPFSGAEKTACSVYEEFFQQGDAEVKLGLRHSAELMDRSKKGEIPRMQVGFYDFVVIPAYRLLEGLLGEAIKPINEELKKNRDTWKQLQDSGESYHFNFTADEL